MPILIAVAKKGRSPEVAEGVFERLHSLMNQSIKELVPEELHTNFTPLELCSSARSVSKGRSPEDIQYKIIKSAIIHQFYQ